MPMNATTIKTSSDGAWQGDNPLNYAFPLLIVQTTLVLSLSRFLTCLLKPLRQPKVVAEILVSLRFVIPLQTHSHTQLLNSLLKSVLPLFLFVLN